ncbi:MAG TPA: M56 family metallopeptidase [Bryobacteraceae bacterium]|jgi:uncharacterized protein (TIGR03435 family)
MTEMLVAILAAGLNSLWQAAVAAALVWIALKLLPVNAATRYAIWWVVLAVVLVLPVAPQLMTEFRSVWAAREAQPAVAAAPVRAERVAVAVAVEAPAPVMLREAKSAKWPWWIFGLVSAVFAYKMDEIARSYFYLRGMKRRAAESARELPELLPEAARRVRLLISREVSSPMAVGFAHPAVVLPESLMNELSAAEMEHVLLHEMAHIARRDDWTNLAARVLGAALALHPVAWWILRQIEREREIACDDWVVARRGSDSTHARAYAASLARLSELRWARQETLRGNALASGIFGGGSHAVDRIELLLARGRGFSGGVSRARVAVSLAAMLAFVAAASVMPKWVAFAQSQPSFEVASVKAIKPGTAGEPSITTSPDTLTVRFTNLTGLLMWAYQIRDANQISGPEWRMTQEFDITAKAAGRVSTDQLRLMLQSLLEERFKLTLRREQEVVPLYPLVVGKDGVKLHEVQQEPRQGGRIGIDQGGFRMDMVNRISQLTWMLSDFLDNRRVEDKTGLTGVYEISLRVELDESQQRRMPQPGMVFTGFGYAPGVFEAVERMGLRLEAAQGPVDFFAIDQVEMPDAN